MQIKCILATALVAVLFLASTEPAVSQQPPPEFREKLQQFLGTWNGTLNTAFKADASRHSWPLQLTGRYILDSTAVILEGSLNIVGGQTIAWWNIYTWDALEQAVAVIELTNMGEVHQLHGAWEAGPPAALVLEEERTVGEKRHGYNIRLSFPGKNSMEWETSFHEDGKLTVTQKLTAVKK